MNYLLKKDFSHGFIEIFAIEHQETFGDDVAP